MKIGFITSALSAAEEGGWGRYSRSLIESVARHADVVVLTQQGSKNESSLEHVYAGLPPFSFKPSVQWSVFQNAKKYFKDCDAVHVLIEPFSPGAALACKFLGAKFLMTLHGTYSVPPTGLSLQGFFLKFALQSAALTTTGSKQTEMRAREQVQFGECRFIPNGVDLESFHSLPGVQRQRYFLTTGAVKARKGADIGVRALGLLKDDLPDIRYRIIGDTSGASFVEHLRALAKALGVAHRVDIVGLVSEEELLRSYNECTAYVLAAREVAGQF